MCPGFLRCHRHARLVSNHPFVTGEEIPPTNRRVARNQKRLLMRVPNLRGAKHSRYDVVNVNGVADAVPVIQQDDAAGLHLLQWFDRPGGAEWSIDDCGLYDGHRETLIAISE